MDELDIRPLTDDEVAAMGLTLLTEADVKAMIESGELVELPPISDNSL